MTPAPGARNAITVDIALTSACPLRCRFCTVAKTPGPELSARQWGRILDELAQLRRVGLVSIEGGEPLVRSDVGEVVAAGLACAEAVKLVTGGAVPFEALPLGLAHDERFLLEVSVDGPRPVHDYLRDGSHEMAWDFIRAARSAGVRLRLRSVVSSCNLGLLEDWLAEVDDRLPGTAAVGYRFDAIIAPETLAGLGGPQPRAGLTRYDSRGLLPSPAQLAGLYRRLKARRFHRLRFEQSEPFRGCGAGRVPGLSFDPAGRFSFCCEAPGGFGAITAASARACLELLDRQMEAARCRRCRHLADGICDGCWTGQKCGLVGYWRFGDCVSLLQSARELLPTELG